MKVLHVVGQYPSEEDPHSGSFIASQIESLRRQGVEIDVCQLQGVGLWKYFKGISLIRRALRQKQYNLVHAHYMYCGWSARCATKLPLIVSFMGNDVYGDFDDSGKYRLGSVLFHTSFSAILAQTTSMNIAKSRQLANSIKSEKTVVIPNGVNLRTFRPFFVSRDELGLKRGCFYALFAGRKNDPVKKYSLALESVAALARDGIEAELLVLEGKSPDVVARVMNAVDCLLLTSAHEGSPNIVKEAMACNLPIVSVDVGDVRERLSNVDMGFVVSDTVTEIAGALRVVACERRRSRSGRKRIMSLSDDLIASRIIDVYKSVSRYGCS